MVCGFEDVLVEHVGDEVRVPPVGFSAVDEKKVLEEPELTDRVVGCTRCLLSFQSTYADSNVRCSYHIDIVRSIANRQSCLVRSSLAYHLDDLRLL